VWNGPQDSCWFNPLWPKRLKAGQTLLFAKIKTIKGTIDIAW
jgi:hypothetical protein